MKNLLLIVLVLAVVAVEGVALGAGRAGKEKLPNIIVILADDLGYADIGCQGCKDIVTPHIDSIAANGIRFTDGYATHPVCSPSRAGLMSGRYQHRFGFEANSGPEEYAAANFGLPRSEKTLAERLKGAGYATGMVGKWHIGFKEGLRPHERGFDYYYGFLSGARTYLPVRDDKNPLTRNGQPVDDEREYLTDAFARESVAFIERSRDKPFFLYLAFNAVHIPLEATSDYEKRFPHISDPDRKTYAGMTAAMDDAVGDVLATLRKHRLEENTLIFFYSDNGGPTAKNTSRNGPLRGFKTDTYEGGVRVPFMVQWKGKLAAGSVYREMVMGFDVHATAITAAGVAMPTDKPLDGVDLIPFLTGKKTGIPHESLFWRTGNRKHAARVGDWKLVQEKGAPQLFNLANDISESHNLAKANPEKLRQLQAAYDAWDAEMMSPQWVRQDRENAKRGGELRTQPVTAGKSGRGQIIRQRFEELDRNGNGRLAGKELAQSKFFQQADTNGDGAVTLDEAREYYRALRQTGEQAGDAKSKSEKK